MRIIYAPPPDNSCTVHANPTIEGCTDVTYDFFIKHDDWELVQSGEEDYCHITLDKITTMKIVATCSNYRAEEEFIIVPS